MLREISALLESQVTTLRPVDWQRPTPSAGWSIADQIGHLLWTDEVSLLAIRHDPLFLELIEQLSKAGTDTNLVDASAHERAALPPEVLLSAWRDTRGALQQALAAVEPAALIRWFGPPMRPVTMATARVMETWAHSLDVFDALGHELPATEALRAVARIGYRTREYSFRIHGEPFPDSGVRVELTLPTGADITYGPKDAQDRVTGSAWGFASVVTQRRNIADVDLEASGDGASRWMRVAQAFAGPPSAGPAAGPRLPSTSN